MYMIGCLLYIPFISMIFYRWTFFQMTPEQLTPPYWINMGALAITTLAGSRLILCAGQFGFLQDILPFLKGFTLFFWAFATWWIPLLLILGAWRHFAQKIPLAYDPQFWGMVFPLGMYAACTFQLSKALGLPFLLLIPQYFVFLALGAWALVFTGMIQSIARLRKE
jgi:tellurite resistance protein TehA-like permease